MVYIFENETQTVLELVNITTLLKDISNNIIMYNNIMLSSLLFGSFYLFSVSLTLTNKALMEDKKMTDKLFIINCSTLFMSGFVIIYNLHLLNWSHFYKL